MFNLNHLRYFYDAAQEGSLHASARRNCVSQGAVSQGILALERDLKTQLITHSRNKLKLTPHGERCVAWARQVFNSVAALHQAMQHPNEEICGPLTIACTRSLSSALIPSLLAQLRERAPAVVPEVHMGHALEVLDWLANGTVELGFILDNSDLTGVNKCEVYSGHFQLYRSSRRDPSVPLTSWIITGDQWEVRQFRQHYESAYGTTLATAAVVKSWHLIAQLVADDHGIALLPDYVEQTRGEELVPYKLNLEPIPYRIFAAWTKGETLSPAAQLCSGLVTTAVTRAAPA